jgi:hypothetical protein
MPDMPHRWRNNWPPVLSINSDHAGAVAAQLDVAGVPPHVGRAEEEDGRDLLRWPALGAIPAALLALTQEPSVKDRLLKKPTVSIAPFTCRDPARACAQRARRAPTLKALPQ